MYNEINNIIIVWLMQHIHEYKTKLLNNQPKIYILFTYCKNSIRII